MFTYLRLVVLSLMLPAAVQAADTFVPAELQDWREWVLEGHEYRDCPFFFDRNATSDGDYVCAWPGTLDLSVAADGGRFTQQWTVYIDEQWLPLPGDAAYWPHQVELNGRAVEVVQHDGMPSVFVGPGSYRVSGSFAWDERPGVLRVPARSGLINLSLNGQRVERPELTGNGVFLGERRRETQAQNTVSANVYRLISDDVPTRVTTSIRIDVSGGVREELFGPVLLDGFVPVALDSPLPARVEADGKLRVQVRPGQWVLALTARGPDVLNSVSLPESEENFPDSEIWSYRSNDQLRVTAAEGLQPVDPLQVQVPGNWQELPAFRISSGQALEITERSRGIAAADNELLLRRQMWLDFNGDGFIVSDAIGGTMRSDWRLDMAPPFALLSATEYDENLLITNGRDAGLTGVELRRSDVDLDAIGRADTRRTMPVTGWATRFADVSTLLHLPPGHKLLAAPGADRAPASWVSRWQLLDFFLALITTIAAWRLFGRTAGVIALLALVLSFHELNAPVWLWLNLLIAVALLRVAPVGRLRQSVRAYQIVSLVALLLVLVPFVAGQLRIAIYPQLEPQPGVGQMAGFAGIDLEKREIDSFEPTAAPGRGERMAMQSVAPASESLEEVVVVADKPAQRYARYAPNAIVQAGPGIPSWQWNTYQLDWSGPVDAGQTLRLVILPRWIVTVLRFVEVFFMLLFAAVLVAEIVGRRFALPGGLRLGAAPASSILAAGLMTVLMSVSPVAEAQTPDAEILRELQGRLLQPPQCTPRCAEIVAADVDIGANNISMNLTVHALADVAVPLPGSDQGWRANAIQLDGTAASQVIRGTNQALWLRLAAGRHAIRLSGPLPAADSLEIPFPTPPRFIEVKAGGWFIAGIKDSRLLSGSLQLTRLQTDDAGDATVRWESSRFPAFVRIERTIDLDLDWQVTTTVYRIAPTQGALTLEIPLIEGESVMSDGYTVTDGKVLVTMNPNQRATTWRSSLPRVSPLVLLAGTGQPWQEVWRVGVGSIWHAEFSGVPESESAQAAGAARVAEFYPRGGESLGIDAIRPEASQGSTLAFDSVDLEVEHGSRSSSVTMALAYRSTRGAQHLLQLPEGAEVTRVVIDGQVEPLRAEAGELTVPILPGEHDIEVSWRRDGAIATRTQSPQVDIGAPASNIELQLQLPANRWLLATNGPSLGPAVVYWSGLAVILLFAVILGRVRLTPLATHHWVLLGLGFSTFSWPALAIVIAWLLACGARQKWQTKESWWQFNTVQVLIAAFTVIALATIVTNISNGLLGTPYMHVTGNGSYGNTLKWFADRSVTTLPVASAWSVPMWTYKVLILAWALWLSFALLRWLPWVWHSFSSRGYWRSRKETAS